MRTDVENIGNNAVVYFGAVGWCHPCKFLHPLMDKLSDKYENVDIFYVDVDENQELAAEERIMSVPTVKFFVDGEEATSYPGLRNQRDYENAITEYFEV